MFRIANTGNDAKPQSNLVLLNGKNKALLWSREFSFPAGKEADYWHKSGDWPDFCRRPGISYDCKAEAAKLK